MTTTKQEIRARGTTARTVRNTISAALAGLLAAAGCAQAASTFNGPGDSSLTLGMWTSGAYTNTEQAGGVHHSDLSLYSFRIITVAQITKQVSLMTNFARLEGESMRLLDLMAQIELTEGVNIAFGRLLVPGDRAQMAGPYFANVWEYPMVSRYPNAYTGRDNGATLWGNILDKRLLYMAGVFQGKNRSAGLSNDSSRDYLYAGRIAWSFFEPETGYFGNDDYFGTKEILTLGAAFQTQNNGVGLAGAKGDFTAWNIDALLQTRLSTGGHLTLEAAYYDYDTDGVADVAPNDPLCHHTTNCGGATQGDAWKVTAAYLFPTRIGIGQFQPYMRYQEFNPDSGPSNDQWDLGLTYVIAGHNTRISGVYSSMGTDGGPSRDKFILGLQYMY